MLLSAKDIMKSLDEGIQKHGVLTFYEKGAPAIMDFSSVINQIRNMTMNDINTLFRELCDLGYVGEQFVYNAMIAMTDFFNPHAQDKENKEIYSKAENKKQRSNINKNLDSKDLDLTVNQTVHSGNSVNLNAPTHNTDNILRVIQVSQLHFELI
jgi:hypothetical protein